MSTNLHSQTFKMSNITSDQNLGMGNDVEFAMYKFMLLTMKHYLKDEIVYLLDNNLDAVLYNMYKNPSVLVNSSGCETSSIRSDQTSPVIDNSNCKTSNVTSEEKSPVLIDNSNGPTPKIISSLASPVLIDNSKCNTSNVTPQQTSPVDIDDKSPRFYKVRLEDEDSNIDPEDEILCKNIEQHINDELKKSCKGFQDSTTLTEVIVNSIKNYFCKTGDTIEPTNQEFSPEKMCLTPKNTDCQIDETGKLPDTKVPNTEKSSNGINVTYCPCIQSHRKYKSNTKSDSDSQDEIKPNLTILHLIKFA